MKLSESKEYNKKFTDIQQTSKYSVLTEDGYKPVISSNKTIEYTVYKIELEDGLSIECADNHILITEDYNEVFAINSLNKKIRTKFGPKKVLKVENMNYDEEMYDLSIDSEEQTYYTNDILSHNTVLTGSYILWKTMFGRNTTHGIAAQLAGTATEVLDKFKEIMFGLPFCFLPGTKVFNKGMVSFDNGVRVICSTANGNAFRGFSIVGEEILDGSIPSGAILYIDECIEENETVTIKNKETGIIETIKIGELYKRIENDEN